MRSKAVCSSWSPSGSESLLEASSLAGWSRSLMVFSFPRASHHTERECLSAPLLRAHRLGLYGYSPEFVEVEFCEVRGYKLPRPAPAIYQSGRGRATFSPPSCPYCCICCENLVQAVATCYGLDFREFLHCPTPFP